MHQAHKISKRGEYFENNKQKDTTTKQTMKLSRLILVVLVGLSAAAKGQNLRSPTEDLAVYDKGRYLKGGEREGEKRTPCAPGERRDRETKKCVARKKSPIRKKSPTTKSTVTSRSRKRTKSTSTSESTSTDSSRSVRCGPNRSFNGKRCVRKSSRSCRIPKFRCRRSRRNGRCRLTDWQKRAIRRAKRRCRNDTTVRCQFNKRMGRRVCLRCRTNRRGTRVCVRQANSRSESSSTSGDDSDSSSSDD